MRLAPLALALALMPALGAPALADHDHNHPDAGNAASSGPPLTREQYLQKIAEWKQQIQSGPMPDRVKQRVTQLIDGVDGQLQTQTNNYTDPSKMPSEAGFNDFQNTIKAKGQLFHAIHDVGEAHGLHPLRDPADFQKINAAVNQDYASQSQGQQAHAVSDALSKFNFKPEELQKIERSAQAYVNTMSQLSRDAGTLHNIYHQISTKQDPADRGLGGVPSGMQAQHNNDYVNNQPKDPYPLVFSGNQDLANGDAGSAGAKADAALQLSPNDVQALDLAGAANYQMNNVADAAKFAQKALSLDPNDQTAKAILDFASKQAIGNGPNLKGAGDAFGQGGNPGQSPEGGGVLGFSRTLNGGLTASVETGSPQSNMLMRDALASLAVGDAGAAVESLNKALAADPGNLRALAARALALARQHRYGEALQDAEAVLARDPKNQAAMDTRALALNKLKRFKDAEAQARAAIENDPKDAGAWRQLAEALAGLGDRSGSLDALKKAAELDARYKGTLDAALQLPADADLNLLFADDGPSAAAVDAARGAKAASRPWNMKVIGGGALAGVALLLIGLWSTLGGSLERLWHRLTRERVVRASEVRYVVEPAPEEAARPSVEKN